MTRSRAYALIPAAGRSRRMGREKLTLAAAGRPVLLHVITAFQESGTVDSMCVIARKDQTDVIELASEAGAEILILPGETPDMRATVEEGIRWLESRQLMTDNDALLVAPADCIGLRPDAVRAVCDAFFRGRHAVIVPSDGRRRGHPLLLPWRLRSAVFDLPMGTGLNRLLCTDRVPVHAVPCQLSEHEDVDTPEDLDRVARRLE